MFRTMAICPAPICPKPSARKNLNRRAACETGAGILAAALPGVRTLRDVEAAQLARHEASLPATVAKRSPTDAPAGA